MPPLTELISRALVRDGGWLPFEALTAIHMSHRLGALAVFAALLFFVWRLRASPVAVAAWSLRLHGHAMALIEAEAERRRAPREDRS